MPTGPLPAPNVATGALTNQNIPPMIMPAFVGEYAARPKTLPTGTTQQSFPMTVIFHPTAAELASRIQAFELIVLDAMQQGGDGFSIPRRPRRGCVNCAMPMGSGPIRRFAVTAAQT